MASGVWKANGGGDGAEKMPGCCPWSLPAASKPAGQQHCISRTFVVPFIIRQHEFCCQFCLEPCRCLRSLQAPPPGSLRAGIGCWRTPFPPSPPPAEACRAAWRSQGPFAATLPPGCWMGNCSEILSFEAPPGETSGAGPAASGGRVRSG